MNAAELWPSPDRRERWLKLMDMLDPRPGDRVLDVGCGEGQALRYLASEIAPNGHGVGVEYGPKAGERLLRLSDGDSAPFVHAVIADGQNLPFADEAFTAVLCVNVLEAMTDRLAALREMRRILKSDGRLLVAHDDYESQVYACADRELGRRVVRAYADATFASYASSDGQMGRHLRGLVRAAGFGDVAIQVLPLVNTEYREPLLGWVQAQFSHDLVAGVSDLNQDDIDRWHADLEEQSTRGEYVYCVNLYVCLGQNQG